MKLDRGLAEAILKLKPYPAFQMFVGAIHQDGIQAMLDLVNAKPEFVGRLQGRAELSLEICAMLDQAAGVLEKFESKQSLGEDGDARSTRISSTSRGAF